MKIMEYYYNLIYYFFYRGFIQLDIKMDVFDSFADFIADILFKSKIIKVANPTTDKEEIEKRKVHAEIIDKKVTKSLGTMYGHGFAAASLACILIGAYKILKNFLFPDFQDSFIYLIIIFATLAYGLDIYFTQTYDKDVYYINQFNKIKDKRWRRKWAFITALTFPLSITFMVMASKSSYIGGFFFELHQYLFN